MSRTLHPFYSPDISALARSLKQQWAASDGTPGHLQLLNMLARASGYHNFQHWLAAAPAAVAPDSPRPTVRQHDALTQRLLRHFDAQGRLQRWPKKYSEQQQCLWAIWPQLPGRGQHGEAVINDALRQAQTFGDHVLLRRELVNHGLLARTPDCRVYWRLDHVVPAGLQPLVAEVNRRRQAG
ncbi:DUF2087 domain-containing protein [Vogesella urethralis]|uniref:DUF2087 domain-containing protein n=1 Tax=Vogesella urethralis TaxID=2592656 RepID=UPI001185C035|nr:DUF2087 domain-containing protein [Vogesella urethralis]